MQHADADLCDVVLSTGPGCGGDEDECTLFLGQRHDKLARLHPCSPHTPYATYIYMQSLYYFSLPDSRERKKRPTISPGFIQCHCSRIKSWRSQLAAEREIMRKREKSRPSAHGVAIGTRSIFANRKAYSSAPFSRTLSFFWGPCIASTRRKRSLPCSASITRPWRQPLFCGVPSPLRPVSSRAAQAPRCSSYHTAPALPKQPDLHSTYGSAPLSSMPQHAPHCTALHLQFSCSYYS